MKKGESDKENLQKDFKYESFELNVFNERKYWQN